ncbi:MAG TPA: acyl--CoA ligase family protein [Solirubrobacteraceae bacterium]|nr:acyl--CoA ligase family protein [Solirubrobacteraceae bacterium]
MGSQITDVAARMSSPWPARTDVSRTELNPVSFLYRSVAIHPERVAVVHLDRRYTYAELGERVNRLASALRGRGLESHDRVAALCPNVPALLELHHGVPAAGGVLVAINTRLSSPEIRHILEHSGARMVFVDAELESLVSEPPPGVEVIRVDDNGLSTDPYEQLLAEGSPPGVPSPLRDEEEPIAIDYTSGTTGQPKGVVYTFRGAYLNALGEIIEADLGHHPVYLWTLPMFHCNGWCFPWAVTAASGTHICLRQVDPTLSWRLLKDEGVTHYNASPTVQIALVNHPDAARLERQVTSLVAGAPPSPTLLARLEKLNIRTVHVYGLTETYGPQTVGVWHDSWKELSAEDRARLQARQGQQYTTADAVRVVDEQMQDVPYDAATMGEVVIRGNNVMLGYFADEEATKEAFAGGWFHSGDLAVWHPDGAIELRDRGKDVIISGGENISSIEVEQAISAHPAVEDCAVIAVPHEVWGERPKAFVTLKDSATASEDEIIAFCRQRLAHFKCPEAITFGPLPMTSTGKVQKFVLREPEWAGHERRIN